MLTTALLAAIVYFGQTLRNDVRDELKEVRGEYAHLRDKHDAEIAAIGEAKTQMASVEGEVKAARAELGTRLTASQRKSIDLKSEWKKTICSLRRVRLPRLRSRSPRLRRVHQVRRHVDRQLLFTIPPLPRHRKLP